MLKNAFLAACCLFSAACAFSPQKANLAPVVDTAPSQAGSGVTVAVHVVDERASKTLGRRGTAYGAAAEITAAQELSTVVEREVLSALRKQGFETVAGREGADAALTVEIRLLEYSTSQGFWTGGVHIQGTLKAIAGKQGERFEKLYRSEKEERVAVVPTAETNEQWINDALSDVLDQMVNDPELIGFLAG